MPITFAEAWHMWPPLAKQAHMLAVCSALGLTGGGLQPGGICKQLMFIIVSRTQAKGDMVSGVAHEHIMGGTTPAASASTHWPEHVPIIMSMLQGMPDHMQALFDMQVD
jgi:hypothetical protein